MAEENKFKCNGDCLNCRSMSDRKVQWQYCASQFTYNSMRMIEALHESINVMAGTVNELREKIDAIQNSEAYVFDPTKEEKSEIPTFPGTSEKPTDHDTAQEGGGAVE